MATGVICERNGAPPSVKRATQSSRPSLLLLLRTRTHTTQHTNRNHDNQRANKSDTELLNLMASMIQLYLIIIFSFSIDRTSADIESASSATFPA